MNIFELTKESKELQAAYEWLVDPANGQTNSEEQMAELLEIKAENEDDLRQKILNYGILIRMTEAEAQIAKAEIDRLSRIKKIKENFIASLKDRLNYAMESAGLKEVKDATGKVLRVKSPMSIEITDEDAIPEFYLDDQDNTLTFKEKEVVVKINKRGIKEWFKTTGEVLPGVNIHDNKFNIQVK